MKRIMRYLKSRGIKVQSLSTLFSEAISEGIKDALKEMEYKMANNNEKKTEQKSK